MSHRCAALFALLGMVMAICLLLSGCVTGCGPNGNEIKKIMSMPPKQRVKSLAKMPPEKQLDLYFYGQHYEPPLHLDFYIAPNWRSLLPVVRDRLASETDEKRIADMLALLEMISVTQCSLVGRKDVLELASQAIVKLRINTYSGSAKQALQNITNPSKPLPACQ